MFSLRDLLWSSLYGSEAPQTLQTREIAIAVAVAILLLCLYWVFQKIIFHGINDSARASRTGARVLAICIAVAWLLSSLDLMGIYSTIIMLVMATLVMIVDVIYLFVTRRA